MSMSTTVIVQRIEQWPIEELVPYANNARTHSEGQIEQIMASINEFGFVNPVLMGSDKVIVAGHAGVEAARRLGLKTVPVIVLSHLSVAQRRALTIADNQLALNAAWNEDLLQAELAALQESDFDL